MDLVPGDRRCVSRWEENRVPVREMTTVVFLSGKKLLNILSFCVLGVKEMLC